MSVAHMAAVFAYEGKMTLGERMTALALGNHTGTDGFCWPSMKRIAAMTGQHVETTRRQVRGLADKGLLRIVIRKRDDGSRASNGYYLVFPPPQSMGGVATVDQVPPHPGWERPPTLHVGAIEPLTEPLTEQSLSEIAADKPQPASLLAPVSNPLTAKPPKAKKRPEANPDIKHFLDWWNEEYQRAQQTVYVVAWGKDGATVKRLLQSLSLEELTLCATRLLTEQERWVPHMTGAPTIGMLSGCIQTLLRAHPPSDGEAERGHF